MVERAAPEDGSGEPENAQFRDLEAAGRRMEATQRGGEAALHRRGQTSAGRAHERAPGLQVQAAQENQNAAEKGQVPNGGIRHDARRPRGPPKRRVRGPASAARSVPTAFECRRIHPQRVPNVRPQFLSAIWGGQRQLRALRLAQPNAAALVHERRLQLPDGLHSPELALRHAPAERLSKPVRLQHQVGAGLAAQFRFATLAGRHQTRVHQPAAAAAARLAADDQHVSADGRLPTHTAACDFQSVGRPDGCRLPRPLGAHVRAPICGTRYRVAAPVKFPVSNLER